MRELCSADKNPLGLHVVEEGETLVSLCEKYCVSEHEVIRLNGLHAFPPPGTVLLLPPSAGSQGVKTRPRVLTAGSGRTPAFYRKIRKRKNFKNNLHFLRNHAIIIKQF